VPASLGRWSSPDDGGNTFILLSTQKTSYPLRWYLANIAYENKLRITTSDCCRTSRKYLGSYEAFVILKQRIVPCLPICVMKLHFCSIVYQNSRNSRLCETADAVLRLLNFLISENVLFRVALGSYRHTVLYLLAQNRTKSDTHSLTSALSVLCETLQRCVQHSFMSSSSFVH
jgi:hypothetical protein